MSAPDDDKITRRGFLQDSLRGAALVGMGGAGGFLSRLSHGGDMVWQIDPEKCNQCGNCATCCVLKPSAVKCVHSHKLCGYRVRCFGYFNPDTEELTTTAESRQCPTGAIRRTFVESPYYEDTIDEGLCVGCGECVKGSRTFGNGSLYMQVRHNRCLNCNECSIAAACPAKAFVRVPASQPYLFK